MDLTALTKKIEQVSYPFQLAKQEIGKVVVGQTHVIDRLFLALLADGHVLIEGVPGLAKTLMVNTLAQVVQCDFKRIQFTPDLLPADLIGTPIYNPKEGTFTIHKGPIFTHILLADEINRAPAKVQSALLEVMQERQVSIAGTTFPIKFPYLVLATQNPIEQEGTYPLPEAQTDRFLLKIKVDYLTFAEEKEMVIRMASFDARPTAAPILSVENLIEARQVVEEVYLDDKVLDYILKIIFATRQPSKFGLNIESLISIGASPRASIALKMVGKAHAFLSGRAFVTPNDIKLICHDVLRHRIRLSYEAEAEEVTAEDIITRILETIPVP